MLKRRYYIALFFIGLITSSCSEFSRVINKGSTSEQYALATKLYEAKKYKKAVQLFEKVVPAYRGRPQMERIQYMLSNAYYQTKDYMLAAYHFDRFTKNYPKSTKKKEAAFLSAHSYYLSIFRSTLDQSGTKTAIDAFQKFIDTYPDSDKIDEANKYVKEMQTRLEKKAYDIAYQYYHREEYKAAIVAFDNFLSKNLGTSFKEDALFYKAKAAYGVALKSIEIKKEKRIKAALQAFNRLERSFKNSKYKTEIAQLRKNLQNELN